jgi:Zn-dependent protease
MTAALFMLAVYLAARPAGRSLASSATGIAFAAAVIGGA